MTPLTPEPAYDPDGPRPPDGRPENPLHPGASAAPPAASAYRTTRHSAAVRKALSWYERKLGWTVEGEPPQLATGRSFDALWLPATAGLPLLARRPRTGPALRAGPTVWLLVAEGGATDLPGLLQWLGWGNLGPELGLGACGVGGRVPAPAPGPLHARRWEAAWLRPPTPGDVRRTLPALNFEGSRTAPDLADLVASAATECHRALLRRPRPSARPTGSLGAPAEEPTRHRLKRYGTAPDHANTAPAGATDQLPAFS